MILIRVVHWYTILQVMIRRLLKEYVYTILPNVISPDKILSTVGLSSLRFSGFLERWLSCTKRLQYGMRVTVGIMKKTMEAKLKGVLIRNKLVGPVIQFVG